MIQTLPCPGCHRTLVLAGETSLQAVLRCRHCSHQFVLGEMVEAELGFWEVVDDPSAPAPKVIGTGDVAADDAVLELSMSKEYVSPHSLLKNQTQSTKVDWSKFEPITHEQYERMRRKGKSPIWSMLSVLLGGLASIPIATLLIWHVLGKDPLQMGPVVGRYMPWIVPTRFQPDEPIFDEDNHRPAPPAGASGFRRFDNVMNSSQSEFSAMTGGSPEDTDATAVAEPTETTTTAQSRPFRIRDRRAPRAVPSPTDSAAESPENESTTEGPLMRENPPSDVFTLINQVEKYLETWNERGEDRELHKRLALQIYSNLASLALAIEQLPAESPLRRLVRTELHSVGQQIAQHADIQQLIQQGSIFWLKNHPDGLVGLAIVMSVASTSESDNAWQITPATAVREEAFQITVPKEILPSLSAGQNILVIGCFPRAKPAAELPELSPKSTSMLTANYVHVLEP